MTAHQGDPTMAATTARTADQDPAQAAARTADQDPAPAATRAVPPEPLYGGGDGTRRVTVRDIAAAKARGEKWPMLTAYDALTARIFDDAGIPVLLVGDTAGMVVY